MKTFIKNIGKIFLPIIIIVLAILIYIGSENEVDPDWGNVKKLLNPEDLFTLEFASDSLQTLLEDFHYTKFKNDSLAFELISEPFLPTMEYEKFKHFFKILTEKRFNVISTVTGTGSSTLIDRVARLITLDKNKIKTIHCAPQFDLIYHEQYIGKKIENKFEKGELLKLWDVCLANPKENYVVVIDNFDKINPETFFGSEIWENLSEEAGKINIENTSVQVPKNFYMISTIVSGLGSRIPLNNEHFKRLGSSHFLHPETTELAIYLHDKKLELTKMIDPRNKVVIGLNEFKEYKALNDDTNIHRFLYFFKKANELVSKNFSSRLQLGQWNNLRKLFLPEDFNQLVQTFITHVNSSTNSDITKEEFEPIFYSLKHNGKIEGSNPIAAGFRVFKDWGFFTEFVVAASFAVITALFSAYYVRKRKKLINKYLEQSDSIYQKYSKSHLHSGDALAELIKLKKEIDEDAKSGKINYAEAIFFYNSITDRSQAIEITRNINQSFMDLIETFLDDNVITKSEHKKLNTFLDKIKFKIPKDDYLRLKDEVAKVWEEHGEK